MKKETIIILICLLALSIALVVGAISGCDSAKRFGCDGFVSPSDPSPTPTTETVTKTDPAPTPVCPPAVNTNRRYLGLNLGSTLDWEGNRVFADAFKMSRTMRKTAGPGNATLDAAGWPTEDFKVILWHGITRMNGTYALSFTGQASVRAGFGTCTVSKIDYNAVTNTSTASLTYLSEDGSGLELRFTDTRRTESSAANTGVTNIKCMRPVSVGAATSYPPSRLFTDQFGHVLRMFKGGRFMDFTATNGKLAEDAWSTRVLPANPSQAPNDNYSGYGWQGKGAAWEYVILIANEFDIDPWICVPVAADDDYITNLAKLFKYGSDGVDPYDSPQADPLWPPLEKGRALYVEYANELWNSAGGFSQFHWNHDKAVAEAAAGDVLDYDGDNDQWTVTWRRAANRTVEISNIFRSVYTDAAMMTVVRPMFLWQIGNGQQFGQKGLDFIDGYYNNGNGANVAVPHPVSYFIYGGSGSAYYSPDNRSDSLTLANIWQSGGYDLETWARYQILDASLAAAFGLKRTAYEGGPSMEALGHSESVKEQAWNDPRMKKLVIDHHNFWEECGGDEFFYFFLGGQDHQKYFRWNMVRNIFDPVNTSPKLQAVVDLALRAKKLPSIGTAAPANLDGNQWAAISRGWGTAGKGGVSLTADPKRDDIRWASYNFITTAKGLYQVVVTCDGDGVLDLYLNDVLIERIFVSGGSAHRSAPLELTADLHGVRLACTAKRVRVNTVGLK